MPSLQSFKLLRHPAINPLHHGDDAPGDKEDHHGVADLCKPEGGTLDGLGGKHGLRSGPACHLFDELSGFLPVPIEFTNSEGKAPVPASDRESVSPVSICLAASSKAARNWPLWEALPVIKVVSDIHNTASRQE